MLYPRSFLSGCLSLYEEDQNCSAVREICSFFNFANMLSSTWHTDSISLLLTERAPLLNYVPHGNSFQSVPATLYFGNSSPARSDRKRARYMLFRLDVKHCLQSFWKLFFFSIHQIFSVIFYTARLTATILILIHYILCGICCLLHTDRIFLPAWLMLFIAKPIWSIQRLLLTRCNNWDTASNALPLLSAKLLIASPAWVDCFTPFSTALLVCFCCHNCRIRGFLNITQILRTCMLACFDCCARFFISCATTAKPFLVLPLLLLR